jgi:ferritin-like metal-binding protein YciE
MLYQTLHSMLDLQLQELYAAESHVARELKNFADGAVSSEFKSQLVRHSQETEQHVQAMAEVLQKRNLSTHEAKCRVMDSLIKRGNEIVQSRGDDMLRDLGLVLTMRTIDTLEQSAYENAKIMAEVLGENDVVKVVERHLREEGQQERSWTVLAEDMVDALVVAAAKARRSTAEGMEGVRQ